MRCMIVIVLAALLHIPAAFAQEEVAEQEAAPPVSVSWATGGLVGVNLQNHEFAGGYLLTGPRFTVQPAERLLFTWGFSYEVAPISGNHGFVGLASLEFVVAKWLGIDVFPSVIVDWSENQETGELQTAWFAGGGAGVSFLLPGRKCLSPWMFYSKTLGDKGSGLSWGLTFVVGL